jgi:hypothetical protein
VLRHAFSVAPPGEGRGLTRTEWVDGTRELGLVIDHGYRITGEPRLVLERGYDNAVAAALESLEPESQRSAHALVDAYEASLRIQRWATTKDSPRHRALAGLAEASAARALGRFNVLSKLDEASAAASPGAASGNWALRARATLLAKPPGAGLGDPAAAACPPTWSDVRGSSGRAASNADDDEVLDVEPAPDAAVPPCWGLYVFAATRALATEDDPERLARALLALAERPHRAALTASLTERLRGLVKLSASGDLDGNERSYAAAARGGRDAASSNLADRARRATVYAALLRTVKYGASPATADVLFGRLATLRDVTGGYGSSSATVAVLRALLSSQLDGRGTTHVRVRVTAPGQGALDREVDVPASGFVAIPLPAGTLDVSVATAGPGLVARFERPVLRLWSRPPPPQESPVSLEVVWPADAASGTTGTLRVLVRHALDSSLEVDARVPLPPGVTLGGATKGAAQVQGVLFLRAPVDRSGAVLEVPVRFGLAGKVTVPEATAGVARASSALATAPARALVIR